MDPIRLLGVLAPVESLVFLLGHVISAGGNYRRARFGALGGKMLYFGRFIDTNALQLRHWNINTWTDEEVKNWKDSQLASFNAIAVAVRIHDSH